VPVDFPSVSDPDHKDDEHVVGNLVNDAVVPDPNTQEVLASPHRLRASWARIIGEGPDLPGDPTGGDPR